jgi:hypothetical protein
LSPFHQQLKGRQTDSYTWWQHKQVLHSPLKMILMYKLTTKNVLSYFYRNLLFYWTASLENCKTQSMLCMSEEWNHWKITQSFSLSLKFKRRHKMDLKDRLLKPSAGFIREYLQYNLGNGKSCFKGRSTQTTRLDAQVTQIINVPHTNPSNYNQDVLNVIF